MTTGFVHSVSAAAMVNEFDITSFVTKITPSGAQEMSDCTTLGEAHRSYSPSLKSGALSMEGLYRAAALGASLDSIFGTLPTTGQFITGYPEGRAIGKPAYMILADVTRYQIDNVTGDLVKCAIQCQAEQRAVERGVSLHDLVAVTGTENGASVDNTAGTTNGGVGVLHVTAITGAAPSVTIKLQSSTNGSSWSDLGSPFTVITTATKERLEIASGTTVSRFLRYVCTFGGTTSSITFNLSFARR